MIADTTAMDDQALANVIAGFGVTPASLADLAEATPADEIRQRPAFKGGPTLSYVTARFVQDRLDAVVGPANWQSKFEDTQGGVRCGIGINLAGDWVWKWDAGVPSNIEAVKGAHSDAFKRAAVQWGIARDLYEERDEPAAPAAPRSVSRETPIRQAVGAGRAQRYVPRTDEDEKMHEQGELDEEWVCPIHGEAKVVPAGVSKKTGRAYSAFLACPEYGCDETFRP